MFTSVCITFLLACLLSIPEPGSNVYYCSLANERIVHFVCHIGAYLHTVSAYASWISYMKEGGNDASSCVAHSSSNPYKDTSTSTSLMEDSKECSLIRHSDKWHSTGLLPMVILLFQYTSLAGGKSHTTLRKVRLLLMRF